MKLSYSLAALLVISTLNAEENLGTLNISSSTIEDIEKVNKQTESSTINNINTEIIEKINPKNINELLQTIPGISADVRSTVVEIHMRGIGQQEYMWEDTGVSILIDGVPLMQNGGKVKLNMDNIESIKVIKGASSYLYGNGSLAGAIIITTKRQKNKNGGNVGIEYGSENFKSIKGSIHNSGEKYSVNLNSNYNSSDGYWDKTKNYTKSINGKAQYYINDTSDIALGIDYTRIYEETTGGSVTGMKEALKNPKSVGDGNLARSAEFYTNLDKYFLTYNKFFDNESSLKINTYYYKDFYDSLSSAQDLITDDNNFTDTYTNKGDDDITQYGIKTEYIANLTNLSYLIGLDIGKKELDSNDLRLKDYKYRGKNYYKGEITNALSEEDNNALYAELKYKLNPKLTTTANARIDQNKYTYNAKQHDYNGMIWKDISTKKDKKFTNKSYRLGFAYKTDDKKTLYSNISTGFRNPRAQDIFAGDYNSDYKNNLNLKEQTTLNYEIGLRGTKNFTKNMLNYEVSIFQTKTKDIISRNKGTYYSNNDDLMYDNVGDAINRGLELMIHSDKTKNLSFNFAYTYLDSYYKSHKDIYIDMKPYRREAGDTSHNINENSLPRVPKHKIDLIVDYKLTPKINLMTELYAQSKYFADETNFVKIPGYAKVNLKLSYTQNKHLSYFARIDNALDKQYVRTAFLHSDRDSSGILDIEDTTITVDPGRVYYAGIKYTF